MNCRNMSIQQRKALLLAEFKSGKIASVTWSTASKGLTTRTVKLWVEAALASGDKRIVQPNPVKNEKYISCVDMNKYQSGADYPWCNIDVETLQEVKIGNKTYQF